MDSNNKDEDIKNENKNAIFIIVLTIFVVYTMVFLVLYFN